MKTVPVALLVAVLLFAAAPAPAGAAGLGQLTFTITPGTTRCGGHALLPPPAPPFSGEVDNADGSKRSDLGLGCLYFGGGAAGAFPPAAIPDGSTSILAVTGVSGLALTLGPDRGHGPADCTLGADTKTVCLNGAPGTNGSGACTADSDCFGVTGACDQRANCFFGAPVPLPGPINALSVCILNAIRSGVFGTADLLTRQTNVSTTLSSRIYLIGNAASPCPRCVNGRCSSGPRAGRSCTGIGSKQTTLDCPPDPTLFQGRLTVALAPVSTGTSTVSNPGGIFCPGQATPGAFGVPAARITETGSPLVGNLGQPLATTLAGTFCVPATGNFLVDGLSDLPGPGAVSIPGMAGVQLLGIPLP